MIKMILWWFCYDMSWFCHFFIMLLSEFIMKWYIFESDKSMIKKLWKKIVEKWYIFGCSNFIKQIWMILYQKCHEKYMKISWIMIKKIQLFFLKKKKWKMTNIPGAWQKHDFSMIIHGIRKIWFWFFNGF